MNMEPKFSMLLQNYSPISTYACERGERALRFSLVSELLYFLSVRCKSRPQLLMSHILLLCTQSSTHPRTGRWHFTLAGYSGDTDLLQSLGQEFLVDATEVGHELLALLMAVDAANWVGEKDKKESYKIKIHRMVWQHNHSTTQILEVKFIHKIILSFIHK